MNNVVTWKDTEWLGYLEEEEETKEEEEEVEEEEEKEEKMHMQIKVQYGSSF